MTPDDLPPDWRDLWAERAAIMEYDAHLDPQEADRLALLDICSQMPHKQETLF